jgi:ferredoxin-NADP reductase/Na+-transporting NADH:ubiquinone oxidoreductase subunit NqrB
MWQKVDKLIDSITMYRLVIYVLGSLVVVGAGLAVFGDIGFSPIQIILAAGIEVTACWLINWAMGWFFEAPVNGESAIITGLILSLIVPPELSGFNLLFLLAAAGLAIGSKFVLSVNRKHIFNPAALAVVLTALGPRQSADWWVGTAAMAPFVLVGGLLIVRKISREYMLAVFWSVAIILTVLLAFLGGMSVGGALKNLVLSSPALFIGFFMLTEPATAPVRKKMQLIYAALVGWLFLPQIHVGSWYTTPELALVVGNAFSFLVNPKVKLYPMFRQKLKIAYNTIDFAFAPGQRFSYEPGQYMEWTLPHSGKDDRGPRRFLTLASSPTEPEIRIGVKFYPNGSTFKKTLLGITPETKIAAGLLGGDFVMPKDKSKKLAFIAGGIGVTPFRSMAKYLVDTNENRDVVMLYAASTHADVAYSDVFEQARANIGMGTTYIYSNEDLKPGELHAVRGMLSERMISSCIPDFNERVFYISGSHPMVVSVQEALKALGVKKQNIKTDFFPGYA